MYNLIEYSYIYIYFFRQGFLSQALTIHRIARKESEPFFSALPLPPAYEHWNIYLQLCKWDDYDVFLIATPVFTRLLLHEIYYLMKLQFNRLIDAVFVCLVDELILGFCYSDLTRGTGGFKLASTITLVLQVNRLTKCAIHSNNYFKTSGTLWHN